MDHHKLDVDAKHLIDSRPWFKWHSSWS